jgi:tetratricopeptide (TPR) repeat protein
MMSFSKSARWMGWLLSAAVLALLLACAASKTGEQISTEMDEAALREQARADSIKAARELEIRKIKSTASEYHKNRQYTDAIPHLEKVLELDPKNEGAYFMLADCYFRLDQLDEAIAVYRRAIAADPNNGNFHQYLGYMLDRKGHSLETSSADQEAMHTYQEAMASYQKAIELMPESLDAHLALANLYLGQEMEMLAIEHFAKVVEIDENHSEVLQVLAKLYAKNGMKEELAKTYEQLLNLHPQDPIYMLELGKVYTELGRNEEAIILLRDLLAQQEDNVMVCLYLGTALNNEAQCVEAIEIFNRALELEPKNLRALSDLSYSYSENGQHAKAREILGRVAKLDPDYAYRYVVEGEILENEAEPYIKADGTVKYDGKVKFEKAVQEYKKALKDPEWGPYARRKIDYLTPFLPTEEDRFFHGQEG